MNYILVRSGWMQMPVVTKQTTIVAALFALPGWFFIYSGDTLNWVHGFDEVLSLTSIYRPLVEPPPDPVAEYPYLPNFAIVNALLYLPFSFLFELLPGPGDAIIRDVKIWVASSWGYLALVSLPLIASWIFDEKGFKTRTLIVLAVPSLWIQFAIRGTDVLVAALALAAIAAGIHEKWKLAGFIVGLSTFKFTGIPFALTLALYTLMMGKHEEFVSVCIGGLVSQLPNLAYFVFFPEDLLLIFRARGSLSGYSGITHLPRNLVLTDLIIQLNLEEFYVSIGFVLVLFVFIALGTFVSVYRSNLVLGFAIAYVAMAYYIPAEQRVFPLIALLLIASVPVLDNRLIQANIITILVLNWYTEITLLGRPAFGLRYLTVLYSEGFRANVFTVDFSGGKVEHLLILSLIILLIKSGDSSISY